jgi:hypothetical protein
MKKPLFALAIVIAAHVARAQAMDGQAIMKQYQLLKKDPEILEYLRNDLRAAQRIDRLERILRRSVAASRSLRQEAAEARRRRARGMAGVASGDPVASEAGRSMLDSTPRPEALEAQRAKAREIGRDTVMELVASYREIKTAVAERRALRKQI